MCVVCVCVCPENKDEESEECTKLSAGIFMHARSRLHTRTRTRTCTRTHAQTHKHKHISTHARTHARTHLLTHTHARAWAFRVMTWLEQKDADILEARKEVLESMEGIDVYCDQVSSSE